MGDFVSTGVPEAFLITFSTYGTWLHGDPRGSHNRHTNIPGTPALPANPIWERAERALLTHAPVHLCVTSRALVERTILEVCSYRRWKLHAVNARLDHVHVVVTARTAPERAMTTMKAWTTRRLREARLRPRDAATWSRHGSTRYLWNQRAIEGAVGYVLYGQDADQ